MSAIAAPVSPPARLAWADRALTVLIAGLLLVLLTGVALRATGRTALVDYTDSMRPAIAAGDVVIDRSVRAADLRPGQIASIADPGLGGRLITHRVIQVDRAGDRVTVVTRGDANDTGERWVLDANAKVRRMSGRVPWVGHLVVWLAWPPLRSILLLAGAVVLAGFGVSRLREPR